MAFSVYGTGTTFKRKTLDDGTFSCYNSNCKGRKNGQEKQSYKARQERSLSSTFRSCLWENLKGTLSASPAKRFTLCPI